MEHPLISDASSLNNEELASRISDLHKKLTIARKLGNDYLVGQIVMAIASYQQVYSRNQQSQLNKDQSTMDKISSKIDIS